MFLKIDYCLFICFRINYINIVLTFLFLCFDISTFFFFCLMYEIFIFVQSIVYPVVKTYYGVQLTKIGSHDILHQIKIMKLFK